MPKTSKNPATAALQAARDALVTEGKGAAQKAAARLKAEAKRAAGAAAGAVREEAAGLAAGVLRRVMASAAGQNSGGGTGAPPAPMGFRPGASEVNAAAARGVVSTRPSHLGARTRIGPGGVEERVISFRQSMSQYGPNGVNTGLFKTGGTWTFPVNTYATLDPDSMNGRLGLELQLYSEWKLESAYMDFEPRVPTSTTGQMVAAFTPDPYAVTTAGAPTFTNATQLDISVSAPAWQPVRLDMTRGLANTWMFVETVTDLRLTAPGQVWFLHDDVAGLANATWGNVYFGGTMILRGPVSTQGLALFVAPSSLMQTAFHSLSREVRFELFRANRRHRWLLRSRAEYEEATRRPVEEWPALRDPPPPVPPPPISVNLSSASEGVVVSVAGVGAGGALPVDIAGQSAPVVVENDGTQPVNISDEPIEVVVVAPARGLPPRVPGGGARGPPAMRSPAAR